MAGTESNADTETNSEADGEFLKSKRLQYRYFKRIIFWVGLVFVIGTFGVLGLIS